jgi:uncharacterized 2Fe-2S/4Fe-4S cluster protein (DUF4445 family)
VEKVETAIDESFQQHFVEALGIPHEKHAFPMLSRVICLPEPASTTNSAKRKRRTKRPLAED